ncbi:MAG: pyridoxamine 5'-phosphate oxidase family protein [Dethiobacter sp.]|nr:pyridoxamine 5'-phosphate oxidase family protein [Dethiobacter sp.]
MRRKERQITDINRLHEVINNASVCRVAMADGLRPYLLPLSFGFDGKNLYFHSASEGRKIEILKNNPSVCFEFEQEVEIVKGERPCNWSVRYFSVIGEGKAEIVEESEEKLYGLTCILKQYDPDLTYSFSEKEASSVLVFKITIENLTGKAAGR